MGVEPTGARCSRPPTDFEDRGAHRDTSTPTGTVTTPCTPRIPQFSPVVKHRSQLLAINVRPPHLQHRHLLSSAQGALSLNLDN